MRTAWAGSTSVFDMMKVVDAERLSVDRLSGSEANKDRASFTQAVECRRELTLDDLLAAIRSGRPEMPPDLRRRVAVHEVGHALLAALEASGIVQRVSLLATEDTGGEVVAREEPMLTPAGVHRRLRRLLA